MGGWDGECSLQWPHAKRVSRAAAMQMMHSFEAVGIAIPERTLHLPSQAAIRG